MAFADHEIATRKAFYVIANKIDNADKLMTDGHRHRNRFLGPGVPIIDVHVGPADGGLEDANEHVIAPNLWNRHFLEPQPRLGLSLHDRLHCFLHDRKLSTDFADSHRFLRKDFKIQSAKICVICGQNSFRWDDATKCLPRLSKPGRTG